MDTRYHQEPGAKGHLFWKERIKGPSLIKKHHFIKKIQNKRKGSSLQIQNNILCSHIELHWTGVLLNETIRSSECDMMVILVLVLLTNAVILSGKNY